ncbi:hypothetical protein CH063_11838 [Colletotrichum higginsianum]|uniref:Uncharacterized protein n=1 Tax=Colletotrichum higginsianum (strain IMI 349063) TaxID=759273 RepID=H1VN06_COLHI|nr:hypothetical protein CH063_11838 [Colletotrichum higginsianum]
MTAGTRIFMGNHIWLAKRGDEQSAAGRQAAQQDSGSERANRNMHASASREDDNDDDDDDTSVELSH